MLTIGHDYGRIGRDIRRRWDTSINSKIGGIHDEIWVWNECSHDDVASLLPTRDDCESLSICRVRPTRRRKHACVIDTLIKIDIVADLVLCCHLQDCRVEIHHVDAKSAVVSPLPANSRVQIYPMLGVIRAKIAASKPCDCD